MEAREKMEEDNTIFLEEIMNLSVKDGNLVISEKMWTMLSKHTDDPKQLLVSWIKDSFKKAKTQVMKK